MKKAFGAIFDFFESKTGFLILGFLITTVAGSFINNEIQTKKANNDNAFELYKTRLTEAKALQKQLLESSNARSFYLHQALAQLANPTEYTDSDVLKFWAEHVTPTKDSWNKDLYYFHAQARVLFTPELANTILI